MGEFWRDKIKPHREIVDRFVEPLMVDALAKKQQKEKEKEKGDIKAEDESATLLEHLVNHTQGEGFVIALGRLF